MQDLYGDCSIKVYSSFDITRMNEDYYFTVVLPDNNYYSDNTLCLNI